MDAIAYLHFSLALLERQLAKCFDGMSEETWDTPITPNGMTPRETLHHLGDCYLNYARVTRQEAVVWDQWRSTGTTGGERWAELRALREAAVAACDGSDSSLELAVYFLLVHDSYHVGQLALARTSADPNWNSGSLYHD